MRAYIEAENILRYRKLIAISEGDPSRDEARHRMLLRLLAEETAKQETSLDKQSLPALQPLFMAASSGSLL
jgi:hypothetical protein